MPWPPYIQRRQRGLPMVSANAEVFAAGMHISAHLLSASAHAEPTIMMLEGLDDDARVDNRCGAAAMGLQGCSEALL